MERKEESEVKHIKGRGKRKRREGEGQERKGDEEKWWK